jgi:hypothetical protein
VREFVRASGGCVGATQDELTKGLGDEDTVPDPVLNATGGVLVRAACSGEGDGCLYPVSCAATAGAGGTGAGVVTVCVPHSAYGVCREGGPLYDSSHH